MKNLKKAAVVVLAMIICMAACACGATVKADISAYENTEITITGLTDEDITVTPAELAEKKCKKETVTTQGKGKEYTFKAIGPTLQSLTEEYGVVLEEVDELIIIASDGYTKSFDGEFFITHPDVYLSVANGNEPLAEDDQPLRLIIPGATPDNWVKGVVKIQIIK